jgi:hypothetical protein
MKFVQENLKRSLRALHYPLSPEKGAEIEPFAAWPLSRWVGALADIWMAIDAQRELFQESIDCGQSFTLLGRQSRYGAEALAASVLALRN